MKKTWKDIPIGGIIKNPGNSKQNKTGGWRKKEPKVDHDACVSCGRCVLNCPERIIKMENKKVEIDYDYCKGCGICSDICPKEAIKMK